MFAKHFIRFMLVPTLVFTVAAACAQSSESGNPTETPQTVDGAAPAATAPNAQTPDSPPALPTSESAQPAQPSAGAQPDTSQTPATPTTEDTGTGKKHGKHHAQEATDPIEQGKILLESRCSTCHSAPRPNTHTMVEWPEVLNRMAPRAFLRDSEVQQIRQYLEHELSRQSQNTWDNGAGS